MTTSPAFIPVAAACQAPSNVAEMGQRLGVRLNEGHLVCSDHNSQTLEALATF